MLKTLAAFAICFFVLTKQRLRHSEECSMRNYITVSYSNPVTQLVCPLLLFNTRTMGYHSTGESLPCVTFVLPWYVQLFCLLFSCFCFWGEWGSFLRGSHNLSSGISDITVVRSPLWCCTIPVSEQEWVLVALTSVLCDNSIVIV